jgi:hypothetical protein
MRDTPTAWPLAGADPLGAALLEEPWAAGELEELEELEELQAASAAVAQRAAAAYNARRCDCRGASPGVALFVELSMLLRLSGVGHGSTPDPWWRRWVILGQRCLTKRMTGVEQYVKMQ